MPGLNTVTEPSLVCSFQLTLRRLGEVDHILKQLLNKALLASSHSARCIAPRDHPNSFLDIPAYGLSLCQTCINVAPLPLIPGLLILFEACHNGKGTSFKVQKTPTYQHSQMAMGKVVSVMGSDIASSLAEAREYPLWISPSTPMKSRLFGLKSWRRPSSWHCGAWHTVLCQIFLGFMRVYGGFRCRHRFRRDFLEMSVEKTLWTICCTGGKTLQLAAAGACDLR